MTSKYFPFKGKNGQVLSGRRACPAGPAREAAFLPLNHLRQGYFCGTPHLAKVGSDDDRRSTT